MQSFIYSLIQNSFIEFHVILEAKEKKSKDCASCWVISTAQLNVFLHVHLQPINVVVYNDPCVEDSSPG